MKNPSQIELQPGVDTRTNQPKTWEQILALPELPNLPGLVDNVGNSQIRQRATLALSSMDIESTPELQETVFRRVTTENNTPVTGDSAGWYDFISLFKGGREFLQKRGYTRAMVYSNMAKEDQLEILASLQLGVSTIASMHESQETRRVISRDTTVNKATLNPVVDLAREIKKQTKTFQDQLNLPLALSSEAGKINLRFLTGTGVAITLTGLYYAAVACGRGPDSQPPVIIENPQGGETITIQQTQIAPGTEQESFSSLTGEYVDGDGLFTALVRSAAESITNDQNLENLSGITTIDQLDEFIEIMQNELSADEGENLNVTWNLKVAQAIEKFRSTHGIENQGTNPFWSIRVDNFYYTFATVGERNFTLLPRVDEGGNLIDFQMIELVQFEVEVNGVLLRAWGIDNAGSDNDFIFFIENPNIVSETGEVWNFYPNGDGDDNGQPVEVNTNGDSNQMDVFLAGFNQPEPTSFPEPTSLPEIIKIPDLPEDVQKLLADNNINYETVAGTEEGTFIVRVTETGNSYFILHPDGTFDWKQAGLMLPEGYPDWGIWDFKPVDRETERPEDPNGLIRYSTTRDENGQFNRTGAEIQAFGEIAFKLTNDDGTWKWTSRVEAGKNYGEMAELAATVYNTITPIDTTPYKNLDFGIPINLRIEPTVKVNGVGLRGARAQFLGEVEHIIPEIPSELGNTLTLLAFAGVDGVPFFVLDGGMVNGINIVHGFKSSPADFDSDTASHLKVGNMYDISIELLDAVRNGTPYEIIDLTQGIFIQGLTSSELTNIKLIVWALNTKQDLPLEAPIDLTSRTTPWAHWGIYP